mmetsp:Transcript_9797/g.16079  ORF Transcript_9797/g.16079 Transcript_9797/m.16079 type:complete len:367 (-) Transcript_9797:103-1203(-)
MAAFVLFVSISSLHFRTTFVSHNKRFRAQRDARDPLRRANPSRPTRFKHTVEQNIVSSAEAYSAAGHLSIAQLHARRRFINEIKKPDEKVSILRASLAIAAEAYPDMDETYVMSELRRHKYNLARRMPEFRLTPPEIIKKLNRYLYEEQKFQGDQTDFYMPEHCFLNKVLTSRRGNTISLCILYMELARNIGLVLQPVAMPKHLLLKVAEQNLEVEQEMFVDPFYSGEIWSRHDCFNELAYLHKRMAGDPDVVRSDFLETVGPKRVIQRLLTHLKLLYQQEGEEAKGLAACEKLMLLDPNNPDLHKERGIFLYRLQRWAESVVELETYSNAVPEHRRSRKDSFLVQEILRTVREKAHLQARGTLLA